MKNASRYLAVAALMALAAVFLNFHKDRPTPLARPLADFPAQVGEWRMVRNVHFDVRSLEVLKPTDYMSRRYQRPDGAIVDLYVGYHDGASDAGPLHSPRNCLPGSGWYEVSSRPVKVALGPAHQEAVEAVYRNAGRTEVFLYWFQVGGVSVVNEYALKVREVMHSVRNRRRDTCFIRISAPVMAEQPVAASAAESFLKAVKPVLAGYLPS